MLVGLDTKGLNCPLSILRAKKAILRLENDDILSVESTDPGSVKDVEVFCRTKGLQLLKSAHKDNVFIFRIRKIFLGKIS